MFWWWFISSVPNLPTPLTLRGIFGNSFGRSFKTETPRDFDAAHNGISGVLDTLIDDWKFVNEIQLEFIKDY